MSSQFESYVNRIEVAVVELEHKLEGKPAPPKVASAPTQSPSPAAKVAEKSPYTIFLEQFFTPLTEASKKLPEHIQTITQLFKAIFEEVGVVFQNTKKPSEKDLVNYRKSVDAFTQYLVKIPITYKNHAKALEEAAKANNWITSAAPANEVSNNWDIGDFYALKIRAPAEDLVWVKALRNLLVNLEVFVKGNATPADAKPVVNLAAALAAGQDGTSAFGLKHVKDEDKTKNRAAEDKKFTVPSEIAPKSAPKTVTTAAKAPPPSWVRAGNKLSVENYVNDKKLKHEAEEGGKDVIYLYNNKNSVLRLVNKVNSITVDKSTNTSLVVDDVISSIEIVNSKNITIQLNGVAASIVVDSTDEVKVYLTDKAAEKLEVFSSKSGNIVLYVPTKQKDPDTGEEYDGHLELAVPGTVRSVIQNNNLDNSFVKHG